MLVPPVVQFSMDLQTGHLEDRYHARIILLLFTMKLIYIFSESVFPKNCFVFVFVLLSAVRKSGGI